MKDMTEGTGVVPRMCRAQIGCAVIVSSSELAGISAAADPEFIQTALQAAIFWTRVSADTEYATVWMPKMHLADAPLHVGWRKCHLQSGGDTPPVHPVYITHPDRHPDALVARCISRLLKGRGVRAVPTASLCALTEKDAGVPTRPNCAEGGRRALLPQLSKGTRADVLAAACCRANAGSLNFFLLDW